MGLLLARRRVNQGKHFWGHFPSSPPSRNPQTVQPAGSGISANISLLPGLVTVNGGKSKLAQPTTPKTGTQHYRIYTVIQAPVTDIDVRLSFSHVCLQRAAREE